MSTSAQDIKTKVLEKVEAIQAIKTVRGYKAYTNDGDYPLAEVTIGNGEGEVRANVKSLVNYGYTIDVYVEFGTNFTEEKAERVSTEIVDEMLEAFRRDTTLSGTVTYCDQLTWDTQYIEREHETRLLSFNLNVNKIEIIS